MADIVEKSTNYRIKQIEIAEANYYRSLVKALDKIEREVVALANKDLGRTTDGRLIELQSAIAIRPKIKAILDREYLAWSDTVVREGFTKQAKRVEKAFKRIGNIPVEFQELTKGDKKMKTKRELGNKYYNLLSEIASYTNDRSSIEFELEHILKTYVPAKVLKDWIAKAEEELKQHEQNEERE